jgi:hypothetical protein
MDMITLTQAYYELSPFPLVHSKLGVGCKASGAETVICEIPWMRVLCCRQSLVLKSALLPPPSTPSFSLEEGFFIMASDRGGDALTNDKKVSDDDPWAPIDSAARYARSLVGLPMMPRHFQMQPPSPTAKPGYAFLEPVFFASDFVLFHLQRDPEVFPEVAIKTRPLSVFDFFASRWSGVDPRFGRGIGIFWPPKGVDISSPWPLQPETMLRGPWHIHDQRCGQPEQYPRRKVSRNCADIEFDDQYIFDSLLRKKVDRLFAPLFNHRYFTQDVPSLDELLENTAEIMEAITEQGAKEIVAMDHARLTPQILAIKEINQPINKTITSNIIRNPDGTVHKETVTTERMADGSYKASRTVETRPDFKSLPLQFHEDLELFSLIAASEQRMLSALELSSMHSNKERELMASKSSAAAGDNRSLAEIGQRTPFTRSEDSSEKENQGEGKWKWFWSKR